jgi:MoaA/NifB/PqqE/SkfB family radical SAM enzyme
MLPTVAECLDTLGSQFEIVDIVNCDNLSILDLYLSVKKSHRETFNNKQRIVFVITQDRHRNGPGVTLHSLQAILNDIDISNFFVCLVTTNDSIEQHYSEILEVVSTDKVPVHLYQCQGEYTILPCDNSVVPFSKQVSIKHLTDDVDKLSEHQLELLFENKNFCIMPWIGINIEPNSKVRPCCKTKLVIGDCSKNSLEEIWNSAEIKQLRQTMLTGQPAESCSTCYKEESIGRDTLRTSSNRTFANQIHKVQHTKIDGQFDLFELNYWDIRYNNLCNLACRSCNLESSSSWHKSAVHLGLVDKTQSPMMIAGKNENDIFEQIIQHIDQVEHIYFAGGEPLIIENFYKILELLDKKKRYNVQLIYNTNLTKTQLKDKNIFDLWKKFPKVSVGASLDAEYQRGEYLRPGTVWSQIIKNRQQMLEHCPHVDFYVSATVSILNALHVPDFHKSWVDQGLITPEQFNIQILLGPEWLRVDTAPWALKDQIYKKYLDHLAWLKPQDTLGRASNGFQSILNLIKNDRNMNNDYFWQQIDQLDTVHSTDLLQAFPELSTLTRQQL